MIGASVGSVDAGFVRIAAFADDSWVARVTTEESFDILTEWIDYRVDTWEVLSSESESIFALFDPKNEIILSMTVDVSGKEVHVSFLDRPPGSRIEPMKHARGFLLVFLGTGVASNLHIPGNLLIEMRVPAICRDKDLVLDQRYDCLYLNYHVHGVTRLEDEVRSLVEDSQLVYDTSGSVRYEADDGLVYMRLSVLENVDNAVLSVDVVPRERRVVFTVKIPASGVEGSGATLEEALVSANLWIGDSQWPDWLEQNVLPEHRPTPEFDLDTGLLLGELSPLLWPLPQFLELVGQLGG